MRTGLKQASKSQPNIMDLSLIEIAALAEIIGTILIVISLVFVGFELKEGARQTKLSVFQTSVQLELNNV